MSVSRPIRVLIVDDSALVRRLLTDALVNEPDLEVVGTAADPYIARDKLLELKPDVMTLDIEMPRMDGLTFLRKVMRYQPMPVVIISSLGQAGCQAALDALDAGAVEVLAKPSGPLSVGELAMTLANKLRAASHVKRFNQSPRPVPVAAEEAHFANHIIAIGASTGGTEAIATVLRQFPRNAPPVLVSQHLPASFSRAFAERLNSICAIEVKEAEENDEIRPGRALVAPGDLHMVMRSLTRVSLSNGPRVCYQRPSVDVMFASVAKAVGAHSLGVLLTGMGADGAAGLLRMRESGAMTIAQDEATSVVFGMPAEAIRMGAAQVVLGLPQIATDVLRRLRIDGAGHLSRGHHAPDAHHPEPVSHH